MINVVLVGRPNVGKSTIFNSLSGVRTAIEGDLPGTTRDMRDGEIKIPKSYKQDLDVKINIFDTPGYDAFDPETNDFSEFLQQVVIKSVDLADIILFTLDSKAGLLPQDKEILNLIKKSGKHVILVVNKIDELSSNKDADTLKWDYAELGFENIVGVSAVHRKGIKELTKEILKISSQLIEENPGFVDEKKDRKEVRPPIISLIGRPNVGKSSLFNAIIGKDRVVVSDIPGTTRDSIDTELDVDGKRYHFIDTAGIRKNAKLKDKKIERVSIKQTQENISKSDICLFLLDSSRKIQSEDLITAKEITRNKKACIIIITKWDTENENIEEYDLGSDMPKEVEKIQKEFPFLYWAPVIFTSSKKKKNLAQIFEVIDQVYEYARTRLDTKQLNRWLKRVLSEKSPTGTKSVPPKINYVSQVGILPTRLVFFINKKGAVHFSYRRFIENRFRESFGFGGVYLDFEFVEKKKKEY